MGESTILRIPLRLHFCLRKNRKQQKRKGKRQKSVYRLVTAPQGGTQKYTLAFATILHADWSNRQRTAFRRWTQAVHQVVAIQVGRHHFLACPYRFLAAKRQAKADLSSRVIRCLLYTYPSARDLSTSRMPSSA